jgi:hypothetical protein
MCAPVPACPLSTAFLLHDNTSQIANAAPSTAILPIAIPAIAPGPKEAADEAGGAVEVGNVPELDLELAAVETTVSVSVVLDTDTDIVPVDELPVAALMPVDVF